MLENITLTKENKKYIRKQTLTFSFYLTLFLCLYFMIFAPDLAIIAICSFFLCIICLRRILFMICLYCNTVDFVPIIIKDKKRKMAFGNVGRVGSRSGTRYNEYIYVQLPSGRIRREKVEVVRYFYINEGDNGIMIKSVFLNKSFTFQEFIVNEYTKKNQGCSSEIKGITPEEYCQKYSKPNEHIYQINYDEDTRF